MAERAGDLGLIDVLDAVYALDRNDAAWLTGIARAIAPHIDTGLGTHAFTATFAEGRHSLGVPLVVGGRPEWCAIWRENWWEPLMRGADTASMNGMLSFGTVSSAQQLWHAVSNDVPTFDEHLRVLAGRGWAHAFVEHAARQSASERLFYPDSLNLVARDPSGVSVAFVANRKRWVERSELVATKAKFAGVVRHVATAYRLRMRLTRNPQEHTTPDAVLDPGGRVLHADHDARTRDVREALRRAARAIDRAHVGSNREQAVDLWRCLVAQRWTLVDRFESDGRRYLVAARNEPWETRRDLSPRERQVLASVGCGLSNKEISYELALAESTVSTLVGRLARKLGTTTRVGMVRFARAAEVALPTRPPESSGTPSAGSERPRGRRR